MLSSRIIKHGKMRKKKDKIIWKDKITNGGDAIERFFLKQCYGEIDVAGNMRWLTGWEGHCFRLSAPLTPKHAYYKQNHRIYVRRSGPPNITINKLRQEEQEGASHGRPAPSGLLI